MTRINWEAAPRNYDDGVSKAVLYFDNEAVSWNGLVSIDENATGSQSTDQYFDGLLLIVTETLGDFEGSIQAFTYPEQLEKHVGYLSDQTYKRFGLTYRTSSQLGDKIHLLYNAYLKTPDVGWVTESEYGTPNLFKWDIFASSVEIPGARPTSHIVIDVPTAKPQLVTQLENALYGTATANAYLPLPDYIVELFEAQTNLRITQNGDGTWTATGPDSMVTIGLSGSFYISAATVNELDNGVFSAQSY